jgi:hypothetical protein
MWPVLNLSLDVGAHLDSVYERHKVLPKDGLPTGPPDADDPWNMLCVEMPASGDIWDWISGVLTFPWVERFGIRTVVPDGLSTYLKTLLLAAAQSQMFVGERTKDKGGGTPFLGEKRKLYNPDQGTYGLVQNAAVAIRQMLNQQKWHRIAVFHEEWRVEEGEVLAGPQVIGKALLQSYGAEWAQIMRLRGRVGSKKGGVKTTIYEAMLEPHGKGWPGRARKTPEQVSQTVWPLDWEHHLFWRYLAQEIDIPLEAPLPCYADMPEGLPEETLARLRA